MATLLEQLIREQGEEMATRVAARLGIPRETAAKALPAAAAVVFKRFDPSAGREATNGGIDEVLEGTGEQMREQVGAGLGITPDQAAQIVPIVLPVILGFLVRRVPYGGAALALLSSTVEKQGYGTLDEITIRLVQRLLPKPDPSGKPAPSLATRLGRLAGKYFPSTPD
ncbi:MAG: hypothetical protein JNJ70_20730 [Verrucomicrobiales bacterium]|nr:hypothetical protein [Verrucomicrobiales bacterium]